ncbi:MAG: DUF4293 domain-containing protein [Bacteroidales bacterium]|nr:DUF4293 domain-containing protein [Bacteroidales bacterium]
MWQRIQTLYLAIAVGLMTAMFFCVKAVEILPGGAQREYSYAAYVPYLILIILAVFLGLVALSSYRHRIFQMRTAVLAALITLALQVWIAVDYFTAADCVVFRVSAVFPLAAVIMDVLAAANIYSDQLMVESFSSLRSRKKR